MQPLGTSYGFGLGRPFLQQGFFIAPLFSGDEFNSDTPCNWVCFVPVDTSTLQVDQSCTSCGITSKKLTGEGECGGDMTGEGSVGET